MADITFINLTTETFFMKSKNGEIVTFLNDRKLCEQLNSVGLVGKKTKSPYPDSDILIEASSNYYGWFDDALPPEKDGVMYIITPRDAMHLLQSGEPRNDVVIPSRRLWIDEDERAIRPLYESFLIVKPTPDLIQKLDDEYNTQNGGKY